jgi:hypothetical protein
LREAREKRSGDEKRGEEKCKRERVILEEFCL